jgi:hypothetical protein
MDVGASLRFSLGMATIVRGDDARLNLRPAIRAGSTVANGRGIPKASVMV